MKKLTKLAFAAVLTWLPASAMAQTEVRHEVLDNTPGDLLVNLLEKGLEIDDEGNATVTHLVIGGKLNDADWALAESCPNLVSLNLAKVDCERMPKLILAQNKKLENLVLPSNLKILDPLFERNATKTDLVNPPFTVADWYYKPIPTANQIKNIDLPYGISSIMGGAFQGWGKLEKIEIPETVTFDMGYWGTFYGCSSLTEIKFPEEWRLKQTKMDQCFITCCDKLTDIQEFPNVVTMSNHNFEGCGIEPDILFKRFPKITEIPGPGFCRLTCDVKELEVPERIEKLYMSSLAFIKGLERITLHNNGKIFTGSHGTGLCDFAPFIGSTDMLKQVIITGPAFNLAYNDESDISDYVSVFFGSQNYRAEGFSTRLPDDCYLYVDDDKLDEWKATNWNNYMGGRIRGISQLNTGVEGVVVEQPKDDTIYDLTGRKVTNPSAGIYIRGGKKVYIH